MERYPAIFVGDAPGLDFLNSVATTADVPFDWIADGEGLLNWLEQAQLVPDEVLVSMCANVRPAELNRVAGQAREVRAWFAEFVRRHKGRSLTAKAIAQLDPLNLLLERDDAFSRIVAVPARRGLRRETSRRWKTPDSLLLPFAEAMADLVCAEDFSNVKACEGSTCTLLFADHTRGHARRWCSMAICGNRAKQAAHRQRSRTNRN
jgi:predicted RNA-binding Zn ribbon-like protein